MGFITLTSASTNTPIHINVDHIGHVHGVEAEYNGAHLMKDAYTSVGVTTHNNGGFRVIESDEQVMKLIRLQGS